MERAVNDGRYQKEVLCVGLGWVQTYRSAEAAVRVGRTAFKKLVTDFKGI